MSLKVEGLMMKIFIIKMKLNLHHQQLNTKPSNLDEQLLKSSYRNEGDIHNACKWWKKGYFYSVCVGKKKLMRLCLTMLIEV